MTPWTRRGVLAAATAGTLAACTTAHDRPGTPSPAPSPAPKPGSAGTPPATTGPAGAPRWDRLARHVEGRLVLPRDAAYDSVRLLENPRFDGQRPLAVLTVASARDVATGVRFAQDSGVPVALRSGGHGYAGWSGGGSPRALVLDCRGLHGVRLGAEGTATIGAGAALAGVYDALGRRGRAVAGGSCATVGMAGLTLGGGVGVLTRAMGLTCDAVIAMEVVTADGRVRRVTADADGDLFWALRGGGGGHLGVVTSFEMSTHAAPTVSSVYLQWPLAAATEVLPVWQQWAPGADARLWSTLKGLGGAAHPDGPVLLLSATWVGPPDAFDAQLAGLLDHVPAPDVRVPHVRSYRDAMLAYAGCSDLPVARCTTGPGGALTREAFGATSHVAYAGLPAAGVRTLVDHVEAAQSSGLHEAGVSVDALGGRVRDLAPDETAFVHRRALASVQYTATYTSGPPRPADAYVRGFRAAMVPWWGEHAYVNYADPTLRDPGTAYFGANLPRLRDVRAAYDPDGFFTQPQPY
ncbi:MAG: FAD-binding oxidoreductase [Nocardioides sp.]